MARSAILETIHETAKDLHEAGTLDAVTLREFDALCLPPVRRFSAEDIRRIRRKCKVSQPVFARFLNTSTSTVRQWEQDKKHPRGATLRLLDLVDRKGLDALA